MRIVHAALLAAGFAAATFATPAAAMPLGGLEAAGIETAVPLMQVQMQQRRGKGGNRPGAAAVPQQRPQPGNRGGGNRGSNNDAAIAAGVLGVIGGIIAAGQQPEPRYRDRPVYREPPRRFHCPYGSYVNRYGERRCR